MLIKSVNKNFQTSVCGKHRCKINLVSTWTWMINNIWMILSKIYKYIPPLLILFTLRRSWAIESIDNGKHCKSQQKSQEKVDLTSRLKIFDYSKLWYINENAHIFQIFLFSCLYWSDSLYLILYIRGIEYILCLFEYQYFWGFNFN